LSQALFTGPTIPLTRQANAQVRAGRFQLTSVEQLVLRDAAPAPIFSVIAAEAVLNFRRGHDHLHLGV
jgi:hypothetical protein